MIKPIIKSTVIYDAFVAFLQSELQEILEKIYNFGEELKINNREFTDEGFGKLVKFGYSEISNLLDYVDNLETIIGDDKNGSN